jgi:hypothetical protein
MPFTRMRRLTILILVLVGAALPLATAACGGSTKTVVETSAQGGTTVSTVPKVRFAKVKFLLHAGLAFGAFHRYIYKPLKSGGFKKGAPKRKRTFVKAALAGAFAYHELKQARRAALSDDKLRPLVRKIDSIGPKLAAIGAAFKAGNFSPSAIADAAKGVDSLGSQSGNLGAAIKNLPVPSLGG